MNKADAVCDLITFDFDAEELARLAEEAEPEKKVKDHLLFLSHYKMEAGTEAALMRDLLLMLLEGEAGDYFSDYEFNSPIFVDSEDLQDLNTLKRHVKDSLNLIVMLTPGILSRPWCLLEIVTAAENGVQLVPVEIVKPGVPSFPYPDETWFDNL